MCKFLCAWKNPRSGVPMMHQIAATVSCNLAAFVAGSCSTWLAPIALWLTSDHSEIKMTDQEFSWITAILQLGTLFSVMPAGILADRYGRKRILLCAAPLCFASWIMASLTRNITVLYVVRFIQGIYMAVTLTVAPMYVAEISDPKIRGCLGGQFCMMLATGTLFCHATGSYLEYQIYIYVLMILPVIFFLTFLFMPETPYYYFMVENKIDAIESYNWLAKNNNIDNNNDDALWKIEQAVREEMMSRAGWKDLIATKSDRKALLIVESVCIAKCAIGLPTFIAYGRQMFATLSSSNELLTSDQLAIAMSATLIAGAFISSLVSDTIGRRALLIWTSLGTAFANLIIAVYFYLYKEVSINLAGTEWIMYFAVGIFCLVANMGTGQLVSVVQAEFFPSNTRGKGGAISGIVTAGFSFIVLKLYQTLTVAVGIYINYAIFALFSFITTIVIYIILPESAGKTLAEVNALVKRN